MPETNLFENAQFNDTVEFRNAFRMIHRGWSEFLDSMELSVAYVILDRTLGWGKEWEVITIPQIVNGVHGEDGACYSRGARVGFSKAGQAIKRLLSLDMVFSEPLPHNKFRYSINLNWQSMAYRVPRNPVKSAAIRLPGPLPDKALPVARQRAALCDVKCKKNNNKEEQYLTSLTGPSPVESVIQQTIQRHTDRTKNEVKSALSEKTPKAGQCLVIFRNAFRSTFPDVHPTQKQHDGAILARYGKKWAKSGHPDTFGVFLQWCVENWRAICHTHFRRMQSVPQFPAVGFFIALSNRFEEAYAGRAEMHRKLSMTTTEHHIDRLTSQGVPEEIAKEEIAGRRGLADRETELAQREARLIKREAELKKAQEQPTARARPRPLVPVVPRPPEAVQAEWENMPTSFGEYRP